MKENILNYLCSKEPKIMSTMSYASLPQFEDSEETIEIEKEKPKPPYSYTQLIYLAMKNNPGRNMSVMDIYHFIQTHFPFFKYTKNSLWKNSIRHSLSQYKAFVKVDIDPTLAQSRPGRATTDWGLTTNGMFIQRLESELFKQAKREAEKTKASLKKPELFIDILEGKVQSMDNKELNLPNNSIKEADGMKEKIQYYGYQHPDYVHHNPSHPKPPLSYGNLITLALKNSPNGRRSVKELYAFIADNFPFYQSTHMNTWKNSVRHTLCLHKGFQKIDQSDIIVESPNGVINKYKKGKHGHFWSMDPDRMEKEHMELLEVVLKGNKIRKDIELFLQISESQFQF